MEYDSESEEDQLDIDQAVKNRNRKSPIYLFNEALHVNYVSENCLTLLDKLPNLSVVNEDGRTALILVAITNRLSVMAAILRRSDFNINACDLHGKTALHYAIRHGYPRMTEMLLFHPTTDVTMKDTNGKTLLHYLAIFSCSPLCIDLLLNETRIDINAQDQKGFSALHYACVCNSEYIAKELIERGIDIELRDIYRRTAIYMYCTIPKKCGTNEILEYLLKCKANIDIQGPKGKTLIQWLTLPYDNILITLSRLLEYDKSIDINQKDDDGRMALHYATRHKAHKVVALLIKHGAAINKVDNHGCSPIIYAFKAYAIDSVKQLLECGAYVDYSESNTRKFHSIVKLSQFGSMELMNMLALYMFDNIYFLRDHYQMWPMEYQPYSRHFYELYRMKTYGLFNTPYTIFDLLTATQQEAIEYLEYTEQDNDKTKFYEQCEHEFKIYGKDCVEKIKLAFVALGNANSNYTNVISNRN